MVPLSPLRKKIAGHWPGEATTLAPSHHRSQEVTACALHDTGRSSCPFGPPADGVPMPVPVLQFVGWNHPTTDEGAHMAPSSGPVERS
jgi:hypothetical protein